MQTSLRTALRKSLAHNPWRATQISSPFARPQQFRMLRTKGYTQSHEVVHFDKETGIGTIFITKHGQALLGDVVFVELPKVGTQVTQGDSIGAVESVKAAADIYAPVSGTVEEINGLLANQPGILNKSPENQGWLCKIKLSESNEIEVLMDLEAYNKSCEE